MKSFMTNKEVEQFIWFQRSFDGIPLGKLLSNQFHLPWIVAAEYDMRLAALECTTSLFPNIW